MKRALRKVLGSKIVEIWGDWRQLQGEDLCYVYYLPTDIRVMTSRSVEAERSTLGSCFWRSRGSLKERYLLEDGGVGGIIILKSI